MSRQIRIILNPAAGQDRPILGVLNRTLRNQDVEWEAWLTRGPGDAERLALRARAEGADVVAVYGGDGTVAEAAHALVGSDVPLAVLPGGTANVLATEMGIPTDLAAACALACDPRAAVRSIDVGLVDERKFVIAASTGWAARMVSGAVKPVKERLGFLAYVLSGITAIRDLPQSVYQMRLDDRAIEIAGVACIVANIGNLGQQGVALAAGVSPDDGLLDVFVMRGPDPGALYDIFTSMITGTPPGDGLVHWRGRSLDLQSDPPQPVQSDGDAIGNTPSSIRIQPRALKVLVPSNRTN